MCESAKVSGTVTSQASGLPFCSWDQCSTIWPHSSLGDKTNWFLMSRNLSSFNGSPNGVIEHCVPLLSWGTLSTRKAVEAPGVDHLTANADVRGAYPGSKPLGNSNPDLFVCKFKAYRGNWCGMNQALEWRSEAAFSLARSMFVRAAAETVSIEDFTIGSSHAF